jgi:hypothetical protein
VVARRTIGLLIAVRQRAANRARGDSSSIRFHLPAAGRPPRATLGVAWDCGTLVAITDLVLTRRVFAGALIVLAGVAAPAAQRSGASLDDAVRLRSKVEAITRNGEAARPVPLTTIVTEREVDAYLTYDARPHLPAGFTQPGIVILPTLSLSGTATIDLDAIRRQRRSRGVFDPLNYLSGTVSVAVVGRLSGAAGFARFSLESARLAGIPIPKVVVQELLTYYTRTSSKPQGLSLDDPYPLPARIREIQVRRGEALIRQ